MSIIWGGLFDLGQTVITPGAQAAFDRTQEKPIMYLLRHAQGDWGNLEAEDKATNAQALESGGRLMSAYTLSDQTAIWIITDPQVEQPVTTILLPDDY